MSDLKTRNVLMAEFRRAALAHERCPDNDKLSDLVYAAGGRRWRQALDELVSMGQIKIEIAGKNWRIVTLLKEGLSTKPEPSGRAPWRVIDAGGDRRP